jgi:exodeoxyribonuclease V beta subunit
MVDDRREDGTPFRRSLVPGDVAVLCHLHWQGRRVAEALQGLGVPVTVMDRQRVWQSEAAGAVLRLLAAMARPSDRAVALAALAGPCTGLDARAALERPDDWVQALRAAAEQVDRQGVGAALRRLVTVGVPACGRATMLTWARGERLATDFDHVVEELERAQGRGAGTVHALAHWLAHRVHDRSEGDEALCRSMGGVDAVQVMTLHGSKGLTFGVTWLPSFMLPPREGSDAVEARRLLYVGLTRARFVSRVVWMGEPKAASSPLAHLLHARTEASLEAARQVAEGRLSADARSDLSSLAAGSGGSVQVLPLDPGPVAAHPSSASVTLCPPRPMPKIPDRAVTLSFTSLSSVKKRFEVEHEERDVDAGPPMPHDGPREPVTAMDSALRQAGPSGAALGTLVHDALAEPEAFASLAAGSSVEPLQAALERHAGGLKVRSEGALATLARALQHALAAPTGDPEVPTVTEMARRPDRCLRELEVAMPWQGSPVALAEVLRAEGAPWSERVAQVLTLGDARERLGSLVGNIDLAVERDGRWFIYDYKTNFVGDHAAAYAPEALHQAMAAELYPLQAALYAVMLTRWLASRGWRSGGDPVIGGVGYLFLRGMDPLHGSQGSWTWRPSGRLIASLDALLPAAMEPAP